MRFIENVSQETISMLQRIYKHSKHHRARQRAHCLLLSFQRHTTTELVEIFQVDRMTIYHWFHAWESRRLAGLYDQAKQGRPPKCTPEQKAQALHDLQQQASQGLLDLYYFDESGFCVTPYLPYAWQEKGRTIMLKSGPRKRLNILGFLSKNNELQAYSRLSSVDSDVVVRCINDFCKDIDKKTVVVMDNSPIHTSETFQDNIPVWKDRGLDIFYLPKYSPELNCIEILWRFIKYEWIEFDAYKSWTHLVNYVENVLQNFGEKYKIIFG